jgi:hypothetical protein
MLDVLRWRCEINMKMQLRRHRLDGIGSGSWDFKITIVLPADFTTILGVKIQIYILVTF